MGCVNWQAGCLVGFVVLFWVVSLGWLGVFWFGYYAGLWFSLADVMCFGCDVGVLVFWVLWVFTLVGLFVLGFWCCWWIACLMCCCSICLFGCPGVDFVGLLRQRFLVRVAVWCLLALFFGLVDWCGVGGCC